MILKYAIDISINGKLKESKRVGERERKREKEMNQQNHEIQIEAIFIEQYTLETKNITKALQFPQIECKEKTARVYIYFYGVDHQKISHTSLKIRILRPKSLGIDLLSSMKRHVDFIFKIGHCHGNSCTTKRL